MIPIAQDMAKELKTDENFILGLSAYESGWLNQHNRDLHNPFGITNAGGNNLNFPSFQAAADFWTKQWGQYVTNVKDMKTFAQRLQPHYNSVNKSWTTTVQSVEKSVVAWRKVCDK